MTLKVVPRGGSWQITGTVNGERVRRSIKANTKQEAELARIELERALMTTTNRMGITFEEMAERYCRFRNPHPSVQAYVKRIARQFGAKDIGQIRLDEVRDWAIDIGSQDATVRKYVGFTRTVMLYGEKAGVYELRKRPRCELPKEPPPRDRFLDSDAEVARLIEHADDWFKPFVTTLFHTGARLNEALGLRRRDVSVQAIEGQVVHLVRYGTRKGSGVMHWRSVPLNDVAKRALLPLLVGLRPDDLVFKGQEGGRLWPQKVYKPWHDMCQCAGVVEFTPHDARRTFATLLIRKGVHPEAIRKLLGHEGEDMLKRYAYLAPTQLAGAVKLLG